MIEGRGKARWSRLTLGKLWLVVPLIAGGAMAFRGEVDGRRVAWERDLQLVRQAYDAGDGERALEVLDEAIDRWSWPVEERSDLVEARARIAEVARQFERGIVAFKGERHFEALAAFNDVIDLERRPENAYQQRARKFVNSGRSSVMADVRGALIRGTESLRIGLLGAALEEYRFAVRASNGDGGVCARIVKELERSSEGILARLASLAATDPAQARASCELLTDLLPRTSALRASVESLRVARPR